MTTSEGLQRFRGKFKLSAVDAARIAGITGAAYSYYEKDGKASLPTTATLIKWSDYFGVSIDYILGRTDIINNALTPNNSDGDTKNKKSASSQQNLFAENDADKIRQLQEQIDALQIQIDALRAALKTQGLKV